MSPPNEVGASRRAVRLPSRRTGSVSVVSAWPGVTRGQRLAQARPAQETTGDSTHSTNRPRHTDETPVFEQRRSSRSPPLRIAVRDPGPVTLSRDRESEDILAARLEISMRPVLAPQHEALGKPTYQAARRASIRRASMARVSSPVRNRAADALSRRSSTAESRRSRRSMDRRWASASP